MNSPIENRQETLDFLDENEEGVHLISKDPREENPKGKGNKIQP